MTSLYVDTSGQETLCRDCPRACGALRTEEAGAGFCGCGTVPRVAKAMLHHWEEPPISGERGAGAVFFTGCTLRCIYCQNREISTQAQRGRAYTPEALSQLFFSLVDQGAHTINLITPSPYIPAIRAALLVQKLPVPVVFNSGGYESVEALRSLAGLVDVYLPDLKYVSPALAGSLSHAPDYPQRALEAIKEMVGQTGTAWVEEEGILRRGTLIRHLILPGHTNESCRVLEVIKERFPGIRVSLMAQYTPIALLPHHPELNRGITQRELEKVEARLFDLNLDGFVQSRKAKGKEFIPDFMGSAESMPKS